MYEVFKNYKFKKGKQFIDILGKGVYLKALEIGGSRKPAWLSKTKRIQLTWGHRYIQCNFVILLRWETWEVDVSEVDSKSLAYSPASS